MKQLTIILLCFVSVSAFAQTQIDSGQIRRLPIAKLVTPTTPTNGQVIKYNSTSGKWEPGTDSGGSVSLPVNRIGFGNGSSIQTDPRILVDSTLKAVVVNGTGTKLSVTSMQPGLLDMKADTTQDRQTFFKLDPFRTSSYTSAPFGLSVERFVQSGTYPNLVWSMGPNLQGNSGVPFIATKPSMGISWETSYSDGGVATAEWHEHFKQPDSTNVRLKSYTIRYRNGVDPSRLLDVDFYQKVDRFYLKNPRTPDQTYFAVSRNNTNGYGTMGLYSNLSSIVTTVNEDGGAAYAAFSMTSTRSVKQFSFTGQTRFTLSNNTFWESTDIFTIPTVYSTNISVQNLDIGSSGSGGIYLGSARFLWAGTSQINFIGGYGAGPNRATVPSGGNGNIVIGYNAGNTISASTRGLIALGTGSARSVSSSGTIAFGDYAIGQGNPAKTIAIGDSAMFNQNLSNKLWLENSSGSTPLLSGDFSTNMAGVNVTNAAPNSTWQVNGSIANSILVISGNTTLDATHHTAIIPNGSSFTVTLPSASSITGRIYRIINKTSGSVTIGSYVNLAGSTVTTVATATAIIVQSDGTNWQQIQ